MGTRAKKKPAPVTIRKSIPTRLQLGILGLLTGICVWLLYFGLKQVVPSDAPWALSELSIAILVLVWFVFGAEPAEAAHASLKDWLNSHRRVRIAAVSVAILCGIGGAVVWYVAPENRLSRSLLASASADAPDPFFDICIQEVKEAGKDLAGFDLVNFDHPTGCVSDPIRTLIDTAHKHALLLVGEPASGKRAVLKRLRAELAERREPSLLLTIRECATSEQASQFMPNCIENALLHAALDSFAADRAAVAVRGYLLKPDWWLFIDGLDDPGDERLVVPMLRSLRVRTAQSTRHVVANARTQNLANVLYHARIDDDVRDTMRAFSVYSVTGLSPAGTEQMLTRMSDERNSVAITLRLLSKCQSKDAALARSIISSPGLLTQLADFRPPSSRDSCDPAIGEAIRTWLIAARFEAYCRSDLCGNDIQKQELHDLVDCFQKASKDNHGTLSRSWIAAVLLNSSTCSVKPDRYHNVESVIRTLMEIGLLEVTGLDEYRTIAEWNG